MGPIASVNQDRLVALIQRVNRRVNAAYLESAYQANYFELARRTSWLTEIPLASPSGGTSSFAVLYALLTLLRAGGVKRILELGAGQSSILFDQYATECGAEVVHVDDNEAWLDRATAARAPGVRALHATLSPLKVNGRIIEWYSCPRPPGPFDLVLVDGPEAWSARTRFNRHGILRWLPDVMAPESVLLVDDSNRRGEKVLVTEIQKLLRHAGYQTQAHKVVGASSVTVIATRVFQHILYI